MGVLERIGTGPVHAKLYILSAENIQLMSNRFPFLCRLVGQQRRQSKAAKRKRKQKTEKGRDDGGSHQLDWTLAPCR